MGGFRGLPFLLSLLLLVLLSQPSVIAPSLGVTRGYIDYKDVLQDGYAQEDVIVLTDSPEEILGSYEFVGDIAPWLRIEPAENFTFSAAKQQKLTIIVEPPPDARLQSYSGGVRILTGEIARTEGGKIGTSTRAAFLIKIGIGISGVQRLECSAGGIQIKSTEIGQPFEFVASVLNRGNVRIRPDYVILIYDQYQTKLVANITVPGTVEILPTATGEFLTHVEHDLPVGQYWAEVKIPLCNDGAFFTFDVLDRGGVEDKGDLLSIETEPWAKTGEIIPINAVFKNLGSRTVAAKFKGTITTRLDGKLVKVIDSDTYNVPEGQTAKLETFFNPTAPGQYIVAGRVLYNNKLTYQKSTLINVEGPAMVAVQNWTGTILFILLIIIVILVLLILIAKKRRERKRPGYSHMIIRR